MKIFVSITLTLFFSLAVFSENVLEGTYRGREWGLISWGKPCTVEITRTPSLDDIGFSTYTVSIEGFAHQEQENSWTINEQITLKKRTISFKSGSYGKGESKHGATLYFKKEELNQVYLWNAYLFSPAQTFTCGCLQKDSEGLNI